MKKKIMLSAVVLIAMLGVAFASCEGNDGKASRDTQTRTDAPACLNGVDANNDGICDECGAGFVDADGDGICDNIGTGTCKGCGAGFVDADGDGVCDNIGTGAGKGCGGRMGHGNRGGNSPRGGK